MKFLKFLLMTTMFLLVGLLTFAQDSTVVHAIQSVLPVLEGKSSVWATVFMIAAFVSEGLSLIPPKYVPANGLLHGLYLLFRAVFPPKS